MSEWSTKKERTNIDLWAMTSDSSGTKADSGKGMYGKKKDEGQRKSKVTEGKKSDKKPIEQKPPQKKKEEPPKKKGKG